MEIDFPNGKKLRLVVGDITKIRVDAIVNAANSALRGGGGVDGAIHRAGGSAIMRELDEIRAGSGDCPPGSAVVTTAGALPAQYVIHAVGPVYQDGQHGEPAQLASLSQISGTGRRARRADDELSGHQHRRLRLSHRGSRRGRAR